jgi:hypothetical protein
MSWIHVRPEGRHSCLHYGYCEEHKIFWLIGYHLTEPPEECVMTEARATEFFSGYRGWNYDDGTAIGFCQFCEPAKFVELEKQHRGEASMKPLQIYVPGEGFSNGETLTEHQLQSVRRFALDRHPTK